MAGAVDFPQQATETGWHLDEAWRIAAGPAGQPAYAGTVVFAAVDEYWKNPNPDNSVWAAMSAMQDFVGESIPVLEDGQLVGALSESTIVSAYLEVLESIRREENAAV